MTRFGSASTLSQHKEPLISHKKHIEPCRQQIRDMFELLLFTKLAAKPCFITILL
jgi:hypothetical protein